MQQIDAASLGRVFLFFENLRLAFRFYMSESVLLKLTDRSELCDDVKRNLDYASCAHQPTKQRVIAHIRFDTHPRSPSSPPLLPLPYLQAGGSLGKPVYHVTPNRGVADTPRCHSCKETKRSGLRSSSVGMRPRAPCSFRRYVFALKIAFLMVSSTEAVPCVQAGVSLQPSGKGTGASFRVVS